MTIITQPITEKKLSKQTEPLVKNDELNLQKDAEAGNPVIVTLHARARRVNSATTLCVFITALLLLTTGIIGGVYLYRQFAHYKLRHFRGWCSIPYVAEGHIASKPEPLHAESSFHNHDLASQTEISDSIANHYFNEEFDIDVEFERYERIEVPDFSLGRRGRFIHDFSTNKTGIIDMEGRRCFVLPLNRSKILPPRSLYDLISKMRNGYYDVDTEVVRETYRIVLPPLDEVQTLGNYIASECSSLPTYRLERMTSPVYKRSIQNEHKSMFTEFAGMGINEFYITNLDETSN